MHTRDGGRRGFHTKKRGEEGRDVHIREGGGRREEGSPQRRGGKHEQQKEERREAHPTTEGGSKTAHPYLQRSLPAAAPSAPPAPPSCLQ